MNYFQDQGHLQAILSSLTGKQIKEACQIAQDAGDHKLALLLSQAVGSFMPRQIISKQLEEWIELGVCCCLFAIHFTCHGRHGPKAISI